MTAIRSLDDLKQFREAALDNKARDAKLGQTQVIVSLGSCGIAAGALRTMQALLEQSKAEHLQNIQISLTGCNGQCEQEPIVQVITGGQQKVTYGKVSPEVVLRILHEHIVGGRVVQEYVI
jgi:NADP-reducing hydrogenase subunit HndB